MSSNSEVQTTENRTRNTNKLFTTMNTTNSNNMTVQPDVRSFALSEIFAGENAREIFDPAELAELVQTMRDSREKMGSTLQPLLGTMREDGVTCELIAGERRLRAAPEAGYERLEVKIVPRPSRADALKWNLMENLGRSQLRVVEVAKRVRELLALRNDSGQPVWSQATLAEDMGREPDFIVDCLSVLNCSAKLLEGLNAEPKHMQTASLIGSLPEGLRTDAETKMWFDVLGPMTRDAAREYVGRNYRRDLRRAQWSKDDATLVPERGACTLCPMWGGLRDDVEGKARVHLCLMPSCYDSKTAAHLALIKGRAEESATRVLSEGDATRVFDHLGRVEPACGYVELRGKPGQHLLAVPVDKAPTWEAALKESGVPHVLAFDADGKARTLVESALAIQAAKLGAHKDVFKSDRSTDVVLADSKEEARGKQKAAKLKEEAQAAALVLELNGLLQALSVPHTRAMKLELFDQIKSAGLDAADGELLVRILRPDETVKGVAAWERLEELVETDLMRLEQLDALILLAKNVRAIRYNGLAHVRQAMPVVCREVEWDVAEAEARVKVAGKKTQKEKTQDTGPEEAWLEALLHSEVPVSVPNEHGVYPEVLLPVVLKGENGKRVKLALSVACGGINRWAVAGTHDNGSGGGGGWPGSVREEYTSRGAAVQGGLQELRKSLARHSGGVDPKVEAALARLVAAVVEQRMQELNGLREEFAAAGSQAGGWGVPCDEEEAEYNKALARHLPFVESKEEEREEEEEKEDLRPEDLVEVMDAEQETWLGFATAKELAEEQGLEPGSEREAAWLLFCEVDGEGCFKFEGRRTLAKALQEAGYPGKAATVGNWILRGHWQELRETRLCGEETQD
jgi:ParB/RepB/Spo0J family partition protein